MVIKLFEESYRDDLIDMVMLTKAALGRNPSINPDLLDIHGQYFARGDFFWIAVDEADRVIGCVGYSRCADQTEAFLHRFFVKPCCQRQGIGAQLLQIAEDTMRNQGISTSLVHLGEPEEEWAASYAFYPKHGYVLYAPGYMRKTL